MANFPNYSYAITHLYWSRRRLHKCFLKDGRTFKYIGICTVHTGQVTRVLLHKKNTLMCMGKYLSCFSNDKKLVFRPGSGRIQEISQ